MNEQIFELIQQQNGDCGLVWTEKDKEKFAKLIVRKCIDNMEKSEGDIDFAIWLTKKEFEIEE